MNFKEMMGLLAIGCLCVGGYFWYRPEMLRALTNAGKVSQQVGKGNGNYGEPRRQYGFGQPDEIREKIERHNDNVRRQAQQARARGHKVTIIGGD